MQLVYNHISFLQDGKGTQINPQTAVSNLVNKGNKKVPKRDNSSTTIIIKTSIVWNVLIKIYILLFTDQLIQCMILAGSQLL